MPSHTGQERGDFLGDPGHPRSIFRPGCADIHGVVPGPWSKPAPTGLPRPWLLALVGSRARLRLLAQAITLATPEQLGAVTLAFLTAASRSAATDAASREPLLLGARNLLRSFGKLGDEARDAALESDLPWEDAAAGLLRDIELEPSRQRQNKAHAALLMASLHLAARGHLRAPIANVLCSHDSEARRVGVAIVRTFVDSDIGPPARKAELACQAIGSGITHLSAEQLAEACEVVGVAFSLAPDSGVAIAKALAPALESVPETEAARLLLRGKLRRDRAPAWHHAAWSLATCPALAAAAAERLIQDAASGSLDPSRAHLLRHPGRAVALWRANAQQRESRDLVIAEHAVVNPSASSAVCTALAKLAIYLNQRPRTVQFTKHVIGSAKPAGYPGSVATTQTNKAPQLQTTSGVSRAGRALTESDRIPLLLLRSPVSSVRQSAVRVLARSASWPALAANLRDPSPTIARTSEVVVAARSGITGRALPSRALASALGEGERESIRWLVRGAARPGRPTNPEAATSETTFANDVAMSRELVKLRRRVPGPEVTGAVVGLVSDLRPNTASFERTISAALPTIAWHTGQEGDELLRSFLQSPLPRLRAAAFEALAKRARILDSASLRRETPVLLRAGLSDVHHRVRGSCLRGLIECTTTEAKPLIHRNLLAMASDCEPLEQLTALYVIGRSAPSLAGEAVISQALGAAMRSPANAMVELKAKAIGQSIDYLRRTGQGIVRHDAGSIMRGQVFAEPAGGVAA